MMELNVIGPDEIRISLTCEELESMDVDPESFDYSDTRTRRIIWELFDRAKTETGFDAACCGVVVRVRTKNDGGCDLFVSKISSGSDQRRKDRVFRFDSVDDLLECMSRIGFRQLSKSPPLELDGYFYIRVSGDIDPSSGRILREYAVDETEDYLWDYLTERAGG